MIGDDIVKNGKIAKPIKGMYLYIFPLFKKIRNYILFLQVVEELHVHLVNIYHRQRFNSSMIKKTSQVRREFCSNSFSSRSSSSISSISSYNLGSS